MLLKIMRLFYYFFLIIVYLPVILLPSGAQEISFRLSLLVGFTVVSKRAL